MNELTITEIPILTKYLDLADTVSWIQTRELMLSVLRPYLKKKDTTAKDLFHLPIDDDGVEHNYSVKNEEVEWWKKFKENYNKGEQN